MKDGETYFEIDKNLLLKSINNDNTENTVLQKYLKKYFEKQDLFLFQAKNRLCFFGMTDEPFSGGTCAKKNMLNFYKKIASSGVGTIFTGGAYPFPSKDKKFCLTYSAEETEFYHDFLSEIHGFGTKIFFKINSIYGRADNEHLAFKIFPMSASRSKSLFNQYLPCFRLSDGKINKMAKIMAKMAKFAISFGFDGLLFDDTLYSMMGELSSPEINSRKFGYFSEIFDFSSQILNDIQNISKTTNIFFEISLKTFSDFVYGLNAKKVGTLKSFKIFFDDKIVLDYLEKLVSLGVTGFVFKLGTYETEFLSEFNSLSGQFAFKKLYLKISEYFEEKGILNKFGKKVIFVYHDNFELTQYNDLLENDNFMFDITKFLLSNENYLRELENKDVKSCINCSYCDAAAACGKIACTVNPALMFVEKAEPSNKVVAVVGAGISGIVTALLLASRGAKVELFEKFKKINLKMTAYEIFGFDEKLKKYNIFLQNSLNDYVEHGQINLHLGREFVADDVNKFGAVVVATGSHEYNLNVPGAVLKNVKNIFDVLLNLKELKDKNNVVILVSSEISLKFALFLLQMNVNVSLVIEHPETLFTLPNSKLTFYLFALKKLRANVYLFAKVKRIEADFVELLTDGKLQKENFETIVLNLKSGKKIPYEAKAKCIDTDLFVFEPSKKPNNRLLYDLVTQNYAGNVFLVGDAMKSSTLEETILSAYFVSKNV